MSHTSLTHRVDALELRLRPPATVLSLSLIDDEPFSADADIRVVLREAFAGRTGDHARGLAADDWAELVAARIDGAISKLETAPARRVLLRAAARLPGSVSLTGP